MSRARRRLLIVGVLLAAMAAAGGLEVWSLRAMAPLPDHLRQRMPAYWRTALIGSGDVRAAVRGLYGGTMDERRRAATTLRNLGPRAEAAVPWLAAALADGIPVDDPDEKMHLMVPDDPAQPAETKEGRPPKPTPSLTDRIAAYLFPRRPEPSGRSADGPTSDEASSALAEIGAPAVASLMAVLADPLPEARMEAARALGNIGDPAAIEPLVAAMKDRNYYVRRMAVAALGQFDDPRAFDALVAQVGQSDQYRGTRAQAAMELIGRGDAGQRAVAAMLRSPTYGIRYFAAQAFSNDEDIVLSHVEPFRRIELMDPPHESEVIDALVAASRRDPDDKDEVVAVWSIRGLRRYRDDRVLPALAEALRNRQFSFVVRGIAANGLGNQEDPQAVAVLQEVLTDDEKDRGEITCRHAAYVLAMMGSRPAAEVLAAASKDRRQRVREYVAGVLCDSLNPAAADTLAAILDAPRGIDATMVAVALADMGDPRGLFVLSEEATGAWSRRLPLNRLGAAAVEPLIKAASVHPKEAATELAAIRDPKAVDALMALAADPQSPLRLSAIAALGEIGDKRAADLLASMLGDPEAGQAALVALAGVGDGRALEPLLAQLATRTRTDVYVTLDALARLKDPPAGRSPTAGDAIVAMLRAGQCWPITKEMVARERTSCLGIDMAGMRRRAVEALIAIGDPRGLAICFDVYDVRGSAPVSSPNVIGKVGFQPLVEALADPRPAVRGLAATWLVKSFGVRAIPPVQAAFASIGVEGRTAIVEAVARLADPAAEAFLCHVAAGDADLEVRLAAVGGLLKARTPQSLEAAGRAADADPSAQVRLTAKRALETLPGRPHPAVLTRRWIDRAEVAPFTR